MKRSLRYIDCCDSVVKKIIVSLLCLVTVVLFSCAKMTLEPEASVAATGVVPIVIENFVGEAEGSRSIAPDKLTATQLAANFNLKLTGSNKRMTLPEQTITVDANGKASVTGVPDGTWHLTITAYPKTGATTVAALSGSATVTVWNSLSSEARFTLTPVEGGTGTIRLTINWQEADRYYVQSWYHTELEVSLALYDIATGTMIPNTKARWTRNANNTVNGNPNDRPIRTLTYTGFTTSGTEPPLPAGKYEFRFTVIGGNLPAGVVVKWSDVLYVEPGRQTTGNINIPRLIGVPASPTNFTANCTALNTRGEYTATLSWGSVYNATGYELEMMRYTTGTTRPTTDTQWTNAAGIATTKVFTFNTVPDHANNYTSATHPGGAVARYQSGGLLPGNTNIAFKMRMSSGEGFAVRMRAVNVQGNSPWVYLNAAMVPTAPFAPSNLTAKAGEVLNGDKFLADLGWRAGIVDADGYYELEFMTFTGGTKPTGDNNWNGGQTSRATYTFRGNQAAPVGINARRTTGGLAPVNNAVQYEITGTNVYYTARLRAVSSTGGNSPWLYLQDAIIPAAMYISNTPTRANYQAWEGNVQVWVWDVLMGIRGPRLARNYRMEWIKLAAGDLDLTVNNDSVWDHLRGLTVNYGSNGKEVPTGTTSNNMQQMNNGFPFLFRIRTQTDYGNSAWWYYPVKVVQVP